MHTVHLRSTAYSPFVVYYNQILISLEANSFFQLFSMVLVVTVLFLDTLPPVTVLDIWLISVFTTIFVFFVILGVFLLVSILCSSFLFKGSKSVSPVPSPFPVVLNFCFVHIIFCSFTRGDLFVVADVKYLNIFTRLPSLSLILLPGIESIVFSLSFPIPESSSPVLFSVQQFIGHIPTR